MISLGAFGANNKNMFKLKKKMNVTFDNAVPSENKWSDQDNRLLVSGFLLGSNEWLPFGLSIGQVRFGVHKLETIVEKLT